LTESRQADTVPESRRGWRADTVHGLFEWCARRWPERVAVRHDGGEFTYHDLSAASDTIAADLGPRGVAPGMVVPVLLPRTPELLAVLLAVSKLGAAHAALDPRWPDRRLSAIMARLDSPVLVTRQDGPWPKTGWHPEDGDIARLRRKGRRPAEVRVTADDPAAVYFTSGSSGVPNGVVCAHRGFVRIFDDWAFAPRGTGVVMAQSLAPTWDAFGLDSWGVLLSGGTILLLDGGTLELVQRLRQLIATERVNQVFLPTAVFHAAVEGDLDAFAGLRRVGTGGERLSAEHARRFVERHPGIALYNMYGPVESTVAATDHLVTLADCRGADIPIGSPLPGTEVHILDGGRVCGPGEVGELHLAGDGLALGYLDDEELTERRFARIDTPAGPRRVYRTSDLGFRTPSGRIHFLGRTDDQLKLRGHRVEPQEIELTAQRLPTISRAVVAPVLGENGDCTDLSLFYVPRTGADPTEQDVREQLARILPGYLVPGRAHRLDELLVLEDRKLDRKALAVLATRLRGERFLGEPPRGETEKRVAAVFGDILGTAFVPRDVSFFMLGGNSVSITQTGARLDREFGVSIPVHRLFECPTVAGIAGLLQAAGKLAAKHG
jgi:amino acid adenylation domain-containing protein